ncbi:MAG: hypothetical protein NVS3B14_16430 [Ktedonobacteraceae bacterium]
MGQYQQWLHFQDIDRRLRTTLDALEQELAHYHSQVDSSLQADVLAANPIVSALIAQLAAHSNGRVSPQDTTEIGNNDKTRAGWPQSGQAHASTDQEASLLRRGAFPFLGNDRADIELLQEDMYAFLEEYSQTDPQLELPWWLRKITITHSDVESGKPIDQESMRTNRLVQRWVERWGHQSQPSEPFPPESESTGTADEH